MFFECSLYPNLKKKTEEKRQERLSKMQKAYAAQQKRLKKRIEMLKNLEFHENGKAKFPKDSEGYNIHQQCIDRILGSNY